jgi:hypothetical protein
MIPIFVFTFNLTLSGLIMLLFFAAVIKPFKEHSIKAFVFWISFFSLLSSVLYHISLSYIWSSLFLVITLLLYPFLFLFEEMKEIFGKFVDYILQKWNAFKLAFLNFFRKIKAKLVLFYKNLVEYLKRYWKYMWGGAIIVVFVVVFVLSMIYLNLAWFHALPIGLVVSFVLAFPIFRAQAGEDPEKKFLVQMVYYTAIFGSVVGIILGFIPNIFTILFSIIIFGAILLLFIYREEKRGKLSIKWRFYTTIIFIILIIFLAYLIYLQVSGMVNFL